MVKERSYAFKGSHIDLKGKTVFEGWRVVNAANMTEAKRKYKNFLTKKLHYKKVQIIDVKAL